MGSQARVSHEQQTQFIRASVAYNTPNAATGIVVGHMPQGARIASTHIFVETAFNAGTTNPVQVGYIAEVNGVAQAPITPQTQLATGAGQTAGQTSITPTGQNGVLTTDAALVVSYPQTGAAATAGIATVIVTYFPNT